MVPYKQVSAQLEEGLEKNVYNRFSRNLTLFINIVSFKHNTFIPMLLYLFDASFCLNDLSLLS